MSYLLRRQICINARSVPRIISFKNIHLQNQLCGIHTSRTQLSPESRETTPADKQHNSSPNFDPKIWGVTSPIYIPASRSKLPNIFREPLTVLRTLIRKLYILGLMTYKIGVFRLQTHAKPNFVLWRNKAIENYVQVNQSFSKGNIDKLKGKISIWVEEALKDRVKAIPKTMRIDWEIMKFNETPRLVSLEPIMLPGQPMEYIQLVYRFNTKQRLIILDGSKKEDKQIKDIIDYIVYIMDVANNEIRLIGSVFENKPGERFSKINPKEDKKIVLKRMKECGDIFRLPPK